MKGILLTLFFTTFISSIFAQTVIVERGENSAETETRYHNADFFSKKIKDALAQRNNDKALYYINEWSHMGTLDARFYWSYADYFIAIGEPEKAKKRLMKAYKKYSCYECKEKAEKL